MNTYNIHLHREIRIACLDVEADSPESAISIIRQTATGFADRIDDINDLSARADAVGDDDYSQSVTIDFEPERQRKVAPELLEALELCWQQLSLWVADTESCDLSPEDDEALAKARAAITKAKSAGIIAALVEIDIDTILAQRRQIAVVWSIDDVQELRPDLTDDQAWEVLERASDEHDAGIGITWSVLECHAEMLFGDAPETDEAEGA
jgi:hypothetical protein